MNVITSTSLLERLIEKAEAHSGKRCLVVPETGLALGYSGLLLAGGSRRSRDRDILPGDALMMYTSGTMGQPKGVMIQHRNLLASVRNIASCYSLSDENATLCALPLTHIHGQIASMVSTLCSGGTLVLPSRFSVSKFWETVQRYRHPKVAEAAAVGAPHPMYGEEVEAFVVLKAGHWASEREIRDHCAHFLADCKCPKAIHFVAELPKSASGKIQRLRLMEVAR